jgi:predicted ATPase
VLLKAPREGRGLLRQLEHEAHVAGRLDPRRALRPLALERCPDLLVFPDCGGRPLSDQLAGPMDVGSFLRLAVEIAAALAEVHRHRVIHKDIKPSNILFDPATGEARITDFGIASLLPREHQAPESPALLEGTLAYMAPEQTGRMNRAVDHRSDLYSLGITFYEMLTGALPCQTQDPLEWVHFHIARMPRPPGEIAPGLPAVLSDIVMRLVAKVAEDRYQTAKGLERDLARCLAEWESAGRIEPFPLGEKDVPDRLEIPQKLYGRERDLAALLAAYERVAAAGAPELVLVSGYSGIGKSSLVHELHRPIVRDRGFFLAGKFDQHKRDIPYATFAQAFRALVQQILSESEAMVAARRRRLLAALGQNGQLVIDVIPEIELVIGRQPPVPELPPTEAQNRFHVVFRRFVAELARKEHPLALFLDDLQWADASSLGLLQDLLTHPEVRHLFIVGAYRDNEVSPTHPLVLALDEVRRAGARVSNIVLGPIPRAELAAFVGDALHCRPADAAPLADLVHDKTGGNPFFAIQFLTALHDERLIELDGTTGTFRWDVAKIRAKDFTDNVVDLMVGKLKRLPEAAQAALMHLACLGNRADVAVLATILGASEQETLADLWEAARAGLVLRVDGAYKFLHDRVQEAAYRLVPEGARPAMHLSIGRLLLSHTAPGQLEEKIFEIASQWNRGAALLASREERERAAELDLLAGRRARGSTAYASALAYLRAGSALLHEQDTWERRYDLVFELELHRAECEYLTGALESAEARLSMLARRAATVADVARVTCIRVALYTTQDRSDRGVEACLDYLRRVGVDWPAHPSDEAVQRELDRMWKKLGSRSIEDLVALPPMADAAFCATMNVLTDAISPALFTDANLLCLVVSHMANLSLEHGNSDASCFAYVMLGMVLGSRLGDHETAFRLGKVGLDLVEQRGLDRFKARVYMNVGHSTNPWKRHVRTSLDLLRRAFDTAHQSGDLTFAAYSCNTLITILLAAGDPLGEVQR